MGINPKTKSITPQSKNCIAKPLKNSLLKKIKVIPRTIDTKPHPKSKKDICLFK